MSKPTFSTSDLSRALEADGKHLAAGITVHLYDGSTLGGVRITLSEGLVVKVQRYRDRSPAQRDHQLAEMAREDRLADRRERDERKRERQQEIAAARKSNAEHAARVRTMADALHR